MPLNFGMPLNFDYAWRITMKNRAIHYLLAMVLLCWQATGWAEDIDLFVQPPPAASTDLPNVLILLDNTANWNSAFTNEIAALVSTVNGLPVQTVGGSITANNNGKFRVGLMLFTETGSGNSGDDGGYVRAAVRQLHSNNKTKYMALLNSLDDKDDKSNGGKLGKTMAEAYKYFSGGTPNSGNNKNKTDYAGNASGTVASKAIYALADNALASKSATTYLSPVSANSCAKNFIIYISNGAAQDNSNDTSTATTLLSTAATAAGISGATTTIPISPSGSQDNIGDEWARFMRKSALGVITYTVDIDKVTTGQGPGWSALLKSIATVSSGKYFDVNSTTGAGSEISKALNNIFSEIQAVSSVFASVSLPVSVNTEGTYLNQVYIGMFRPDSTALPRWTGNLKQYKLGMVGGTLNTVDANSSLAINSSTGFITECAQSYWSSADTYWSFSPRGGCLSVANSDNSNSPDGNIVEKGAQAQQLRDSTTRTVKTCSPTFASCTALTDFNNSTVSQSNLGAASTTERDALINWVKGLDIDDENTNSITLNEMRSSAHGDVVHSRPVAINFSNDATPQVVVFYGANDGVLRAVNGNRTASIGGTLAGDELWSFIPPEFYPYIKRLRDNNTQINFFGNPTTSPTPLAKPYGFDGPITSYKDASNTWIYASMRRGGRVLYAFNVTTPSSPSLKWKVGCPNQNNDTNCTTGFTGIGQTWSSPKAFKAAGYATGGAGTEKPLLILGGGYDTCEDSDPHTCTTTAKGKTLYVLDADTGASLATTLVTDRPVVGDVFVITDNTSKLAKWAYAADLGGNIYRISGINANTPIAATHPSAWTITKIASLGCATHTTPTPACTANRKFMFGPDIVEDGGAYVLLIGSGDREKPLTGFTSATGVANQFFMVKDKPTNAGWLSSENSNCAADIICINSLLPITTNATPTAASLAAKKGWNLSLNASEQVVTSAITVFGVVTFSTHTPAVSVSGQCSANLGIARVYNIQFSNAESANGTPERAEEIVGGGLPPSPVAGMVTLDSGETVPFVIGASPDSPLAGGGPSSTTTVIQPKGRVYWYLQQE